MSDSEKRENGDEPESTGPSLTLLYSLIGLAILLAIGFAILIVLPFYHRVAP